MQIISKFCYYLSFIPNTSEKLPSTNFSINFRKNFKSIVCSDFQNYSSQILHSNKLKLMKKTVDQWKTSLISSRIVDITITRLLIGRTLLTYEHLFFRKSSLNCTFYKTAILHHIRSVFKLNNKIEQIFSNNPGHMKILILFLKNTSFASFIWIHCSWHVPLALRLYMAR